MDPCCEEPDLQLVSGETNEVCVSCGVVSHSIAFNRTALKFEVFVKDNYSGENHRGYKRVNHFISCLYQLIGISRSNIPVDILRVTIGLTDLDSIRNAMKGLKKSRYIRCCPRIMEINTRIMSTFKGENIRKSIGLFNQIDRIWCKKKNRIAPDRKSFIPYNFVMRKIMGLLGEDKIAEKIKAVKSEQLLAKLERIWTVIMKYLDWNHNK